MNSNFEKPTSSKKGGSVSLNGSDFDLGLSSDRPYSLRNQKHSSSYSYQSFSASSTSFVSSAQSKPTSSWHPNHSSWTHQPAPFQSGLSNAPTSMVGDISGKTWSSSAPSGLPPSLGIGNKNPNLFSDLLNSALGQGKCNSNVPLKNVPRASPQAPRNSLYSMGDLTDSLPKTGVSVKGNSGSSTGFGSFACSYNNTNVNKNTTTGVHSHQGVSGNGPKKDPFSSLVDFGSKEAGRLNTATKNSNKADNSFGDFLNASNTCSQSSVNHANNHTVSSFMGSCTGSKFQIDDYEIPDKNYAPQKDPPFTAVGGDDVALSMFFNSSSLGSGEAAPLAAQGVGHHQFSELDDWGLESSLGGGGDDMGMTTAELEGLPPPPVGVTASAAMNRGMDSQKQGQYADAIKWLSWALILCERINGAPTMKVLSCRASCYKEVGEYKKAVADCSKVLECDCENVSVLVQRALLYESMEKYKLGAEDLRNVMKLDPANRIAKSSIHRLVKMAE